MAISCGKLGVVQIAEGCGQVVICATLGVGCCGDTADGIMGLGGLGTQGTHI